MISEQRRQFLKGGLHSCTHSSETLISSVTDYLFKDFGIVNSLERQR